MCGIGLVLRGCADQEVVKKEDLLATVKRRGPHYFGSLSIYHEDSAVDLAEMNGAVLHIQGEELAKQPMEHVKGNCLLWNGEIFGGVEPSDCHESGKKLSDTFTISDILQESLSDVHPGEDQNSCLEELASMAANCLAKVEGPYSFIYYHRATNCIIYGRDPFGRRSLVALRRNSVKRTNDFDGVMTYRHDIISSAAVPLTRKDAEDLAEFEFEWEELSVRGIYAQSLLGSSPAYLAEWPSSRLCLGRRCSVTLKTKVADELSTASRFLDLMKQVLLNRINVVHDFSEINSEMVLSNSQSESPIGVLFSGGIDSVFLTAILHECLPSIYSIDLINVTFKSSTENDEELPSPDRLAAVAAYGELRSLYPSRHWRFIHVDVYPEERELYESRVIELIQPQNTHMDLNIGSAFWFASRGVGYTREYDEREVEHTYRTVQSNGRPLLRQGGDGYARGRGETPGAPKPTDPAPCSKDGCGRVSKPGCVYGFCKRCCFKKANQCNQNNSNSKNSADQNEDEATQGDEAMGRVCPVHRKGSAEGSSEERKPEAQWAPPSDRLAGKTPAMSHCKVLLVGIGADEQLAGYSRHRTVFKRGGVGPLLEELNMDTAKIYSRNLGRDDRCISDHGREAWFPFLDETIVAFLQETPLELICNLDEPQGEGDKKILRLAARSVGLGDSTRLVKRAIQFGSRIAKLTNVKYLGSNRSGKGSTQISSVDA